MFLWIDVETTGLDANRDHLLEVAAVFTDGTFAPRSGVWHSVIQYMPDDVDEMQADCRKVVHEMHQSNGLWKELSDGLPLREAEDNFLAFVQKYAPERGSFSFAGNSVWLDASFLKVHMPKIHARAHYRVLDVSALWLFHKDRLSGFDPVKTGHHRAYPDVLESISEASDMRKHLFGDE